MPSADEALTKAELAARVAEIIARRKLTQAAAGEILGRDRRRHCFAGHGTVTNQTD